MNFVAELPEGHTLLEMREVCGSVVVLTDKGVFTLEGNGLVAITPPNEPVTVMVEAQRFMSRWFNWDAAKLPPTEEEKLVHCAISVGNGDAKRFGHGQFIGDDE